MYAQLLQLHDHKAPVWHRAESVFRAHVTPLRVQPSPAHTTTVSFAQERLFALEEHNKQAQVGSAFNVGRMYALLTRLATTNTQHNITSPQTRGHTLTSR